MVKVDRKVCIFAKIVLLDFQVNLMVKVHGYYCMIIQNSLFKLRQTKLRGNVQSARFTMTPFKTDYSSTDKN